MTFPSSRSFLNPEPLLPSDSRVLSVEQVQNWREQGCLLVSGLLPSELIDDARSQLEQMYPLDSAPDDQDFGSNGKLEFPSIVESLNQITLHQRLLTAVSELLSDSDIRLTQSDAWPKYGKSSSSGPYDNRDQRIHVDYPNHTLVHPPAWDSPEAVAVIVYFSDRTECEGGTALVPRTGTDDPVYQFPLIHTPGVGEIPWMNDREQVEEYLKQNFTETYQFRQQLYERELYANYSRGSVLLYRHDIWHRGTPVTPGTCRFAQNLVYKRAECDWLTHWNMGWARNMYRSDMLLEKLIANASVMQRSCLGFPAPGHRYWNRHTIEAVRARYGPLGMDLSPYDSDSSFLS